MDKDKEGYPFTVRLFNTYEPVTSFYQDLIPYWSAEGWHVEVVISKALYRAGRDKKRWLLPSVRVYETPNFGLGGNGRFSKFIVMLSYIVFAIWHTLISRSVDRNLFLTQPPLFFSWGWVLRAIRRQPYFIVLMDLYPDVAIRDQVFATNGLLPRFLKFISRQGLKRADGVIVIGRCMVQKLAALGVAEQKIHFIPNWINETAVKPIPPEHNSFRQAQEWQDKFVIMYSGNIGTSHHFDDILQAAWELRHRKELIFAFIGDGRRRKEIEVFCQQHQLDNIQLLPFQEQTQLSQSLSAGDLHFVSLKSGFEGLVVPSKSYGIMAAGRPILYQGEQDGEIARMITEEAIGEVVPLGNSEQLVETILSYWQNPERVCLEGQRARQVVEERYSKARACQRYTKLLKGD